MRRLQCRKECVGGELEGGGGAQQQLQEVRPGGGDLALEKAPQAPARRYQKHAAQVAPRHGHDAA
jgi:hypothetical protein